MSEEFLPRCQQQIMPRDVEDIYGVVPVQMDSYIQALTHSSASEASNANYEKLEFLGDSCLSFCVATYLYTKFPDKDQGWLTVTRSKIVNTDSLSNFSKSLGLEKFIILSNDLFEKQYHINNKKIQEDVFEALIGVLYLEHGMMSVKNFVIKTMEKFVDWDNIEKNKNYKEQLMWYQHQIKEDLPDYKAIKDENTKEFRVEICLKGRKSWGVHKVKKKAEQLAAKHMLKILHVPIDD